MLLLAPFTYLQGCGSDPISSLTSPDRDGWSQEKPQFWKKRKSSIVKAHMLLLAHLGRADIPATLQADHKYVITKSALLLEEIVKIANLPRNQYGQGWLAPTLGGLEMMQCLTQGISMASRKALGQSGKVRSSCCTLLLGFARAVWISCILGSRSLRLLAGLRKLYDVDYKCNSRSLNEHKHTPEAM